MGGRLARDPVPTIALAACSYAAGAVGLAAKAPYRRLSGGADMVGMGCVQKVNLRCNGVIVTPCRDRKCACRHKAAIIVTEKYSLNTPAVEMGLLATPLAVAVSAIE